MKRYLVLWSLAALFAAGCAKTYRPPLDPTFATDQDKLAKDVSRSRARTLRIPAKRQ